MRYSSQGRFRQQLGFLRRQFLKDGSLPFSNVLSESVVVQEARLSSHLLELGVGSARCVKALLKQGTIVVTQFVKQSLEAVARRDVSKGEAVSALQK